MKILFYILFISLSPLFIKAQHHGSDTSIYDGKRSKPFHLWLQSNIIGAGLNSIPTGIVATNNQSVTISAGGGIFFGLNFGSKISSKFDISAMFAYQSSHLKPKLSNATGNFNRFLPGIFLRYIEGEDTRMNAYFGIGCILVTKAKLEVDATQIKGGGHNVFLYNPALSPALSFTLERFTKTRELSFIIGIMYYNVNYSLQSTILSEKNVSLANLPSSLDYIRTLNGNTINVTLGIGLH